MSEYHVIDDLCLADGECIQEALKEMGYKFEVHEEGTSLYGFQGDAREQKAHIVVRRKHVGAAANDVGFARKPDGTYNLIISEFDVGQPQGKKFTQDIKQLYAKSKVNKQARRMGYTVASQSVDDKGRLKLRILAR